MGLVPSPTVLSVDEMGRIAPPIFTSVGRNGANAPGDVFVIQSLLNDRLPKPHAPIAVNGVADVGTTLAIETYQAAILQMTPPSGKVEPGSPTYYALAARPLVENAPPRGRPFRQDPPEVGDAAVASRRKWTVPASITIAQWAVESAWGASMPPGSNNPFGIKAVGDARGRKYHPRGDQGWMVTNRALPEVQFADPRVRRARPIAGDHPLQERDETGRQPRGVRGRADRRLCDRRTTALR